MSEMPYFQELFQDLAESDDLSLIMVNMGESEDLVKNFVQSRNYTFPVLLDASYKVAGNYGVRFTPTSVLIDREGR